jgi:exopolysaccharide biosynthesis polyprenyl glycosylphosphotransferase
MASVATFVALALWAQVDWFGFSLEFLRHRAGWFVLLPLVWLLLMANLYDIRAASSLRETLRGVTLAAGGGVLLYMILYFSSDPGSLPRRAVLYFLVTVVVLTLLWRWIYIRIFTGRTFRRRVVVVGAGETGGALLRIINGSNHHPFLLVGLVDDDSAKHDLMIEGFPVLGGNAELLKIVEEERISDLIVAIQGPMQGAMFRALLDAQERGVEITRMPVAYEELAGRVPIEHLEADWLLRSFVDEVRAGGLYLLSKRAMDLVGAILGLLILALLYPWLALAISLESGRPVMVRQARIGRGGRHFNVAKFRTMVQNAEADGRAHWAKEDDPRKTRVGRILRKAHLDEFPQFFNVFRGEMSLVGPRPERPELVAELEEEIPFYRARLLVKPGIGGWAQVNYGKGASIHGSAEKLEYDLYYIKHRNLLLDVWIILRSIGQASRY